MAAYSETLRALIRIQAIGFETKPPGFAVPDPLLTNIAKWHLSGCYHQAIRLVLALVTAGCSVTGPSIEDLENPDTAGHIERYLGSARTCRRRIVSAIMNLIEDIDIGRHSTAAQHVLAVHAELDRLRMTSWRSNASLMRSRP